MYQRTQRGQFLVGLAIAVSLLGLAMALIYETWRQDEIHDVAKGYGQTIAQFAVGLRGYVAAVQGGTATLPGNPYVVNGVNWLKPPTCGGLAGNPAEGYIPCSFDGGALGSSYQTTVTDTPATNAIEARTDFFVPRSTSGPDGAAEIAAEVANAALAQQTTPVSGTFYTVFANTPPGAIASVSPGAIAAADRGRVLAVVNNAPSQDPWLRTDGTNKMLADLNAGGHSLTNAKDGTFSGAVRLTNTNDVTLTSTNHAFQIGDSSSLNLAMDNNEIEARNNGGTSTLSLQHDGGDTDFGGAVNIAAGLDVNPPSPGNYAAQFNGDIKVNDIYIAGIGQYASQTAYNMQILHGANAYWVNKPNCSALSHPSTPQIFVGLQYTGAATGADALYDAHATATSSGNRWLVRPYVTKSTMKLGQKGSGAGIVVTLSGTTQTVPAPDAQVFVMTRCQ